jgi:hypothetical protein
MGRGVFGSGGADCPSVCFFTVGRLPEFCLEKGQFDPEVCVFAGCWFGFGIDPIGPPNGAPPRCCLGIGPLPDCWLGVNVRSCDMLPLCPRSAEEVDAVGLAARTLNPQLEQELLLASHSLPQRGHNMLYLSLCHINRR